MPQKFAKKISTKTGRSLKKFAKKFPAKPGDA
jgi:hypothetical protein